MSSDDVHAPVVAGVPDPIKVVVLPTQTVVLPLIVGVASCAPLLKELDAEELHTPALAITVYDVPVVIPVIAPPVPTVGPEGVKVYELVDI